MALSVEEIREIKEAQDAADRRLIEEGRWDEIRERAEANLNVWRTLFSEGKFLPVGRPASSWHLKKEVSVGKEH
jgi:hypothetical protein